jgi:hypothetical protein
MSESVGRVREAVPFRVRTADGRSLEFEYSSPRPAETHDESALLKTLPWYEPGVSVLACKTETPYSRCGNT